MSDDYTARMIQWIMEQAAAGQSQGVPAYDVDPEDFVQDSARRENLYQDQLNDTFDFANSAAAGPGAFAPGAFDSTSTYTPVEQGGMQALRAYAARPNTLEGIIAAGILGGSTAATEIAKLQQAYTEAEANGTLEGSVLATIPMAPPRDYDGAVLPDWESLGFRMGDIEEAYVTESQGGTSGALFDATTGEFLGGGNRQYVLDSNGQPVLADVETQMSDAAQRFADQGLSLPTDQFSAWDLMDPNQAQYSGDLGPNNDAWLQAMQAWQQETMPLPPGDLGKAGQTAMPPGYDKSVQQAGVPPTNDANTLAAMETQQTGAPASWWASQGIAMPEQNVADLVNQIIAGQQTRFGYPGANGDEQDLVTAAAAQGNDVTDIINPADQSMQQLMAQALVLGWGGGQPPEPAPPGAPTNEGTVRNTVGGPPQYNVPGQAPADPNASGPPMPQPTTTPAPAPTPTPAISIDDLIAQLTTTAPQPGDPGTYVRDASVYLPGGGGDIPQGGINHSTQALLQQLMSGGQQGGWDLATSPGAYLAGMRPHPDQYAVQSGRMSADQARPPDWYAQQGGYSPEGPAQQQPTTDQMLSIMGQQARPQPTADQRLSILGQHPPRENMHDVTGDQQVRIGKRTKGTRSNAPTVYNRNPKPKARDTAQSRMAQENADAAWQRTRANQRAAGIGTGAFGRAAAAAYLLAQQGITPLSTQLASRRAAGGSYR